MKKAKHIIQMDESRIVEVNNYDRFGNKKKVYITRNGKRIPIESESKSISSLLKKALQKLRKKRKISRKSRKVTIQNNK